MLSDNRIISFDELTHVLHNTPSLYLEYRVVHSALSTFLSKTPTLHTVEFFNEPYLVFNDYKLHQAKSFRTLITDKSYSTPCAVGFWMNRYNISIKKEHWSLASKCSQESRLKELHWKISHNISHKHFVAQNRNCQ